MAFEFVTKFLGKTNTTIHIPAPSWPSHKNICTVMGAQHRLYRYYDPTTKGLDFDGLIADLDNYAQEGDMVLLHTCAHNPTGVDPTVEQWKAIRDVVEKKGLIAFFDNAYQGFTSGNLEEDAFAVRLFSEKADTIPIISAQSFAKNFGLYGERIGCFSVVCASEEEANRVLSQLKVLARMSYSNPPLHGARIVDIVLKDPILYGLWLEEI
jgi:aspartate/tyrosine/aromatic aminotransferase